MKNIASDLNSVDLNLGQVQVTHTHRVTSIVVFNGVNLPKLVDAVEEITSRNDNFLGIFLQGNSLFKFSILLAISLFSIVFKLEKC